MWRNQAVLKSPGIAKNSVSCLVGLPLRSCSLNRSLAAPATCGLATFGLLQSILIQWSPASRKCPSVDRLPGAVQCPLCLRYTNTPFKTTTQGPPGGFFSSASSSWSADHHCHTSGLFHYFLPFSLFTLFHFWHRNKLVCQPFLCNIDLLRFCSIWRKTWSEILTWSSVIW